MKKRGLGTSLIVFQPFPSSFSGGCGIRTCDRLSPGEKNAIEQAPTDDIAAFELYTRANNLLLTSFSSAGRTNLLQASDREIVEAAKKAGLTCYSSCNGRGGIPAHDVDFAALEGIIVCACAYFLRLIRAQRHVRTVAGLQVCECISCMASSCGETKGIISGDGSVK